MSFLIVVSITTCQKTRSRKKREGGCQVGWHCRVHSRQGNLSQGHFSTIPTERGKYEFGKGLGAVIVKDGYIVCTAHHRDSETCLGLFKKLGTKIINHHDGSISR